MVERTLSGMCDWERKKAVFLLSVAEDLGIDVSGFGELSVNDNSGYTYLWVEDYNFSLFMPINCELIKEDVCALWSNPNTSEEIELELTTNTTLSEIEAWASDLDTNISEDNN